MANPVYDELLAAGQILIAEFGREVSYRPGGTVNRVADEPWRGKIQAPEVTIIAAIFDASGVDQQNWPDVTFTKKALVSPAQVTITPSLGDSITDGQTTYGIARVIESKPGDTSLLYTLLLSTER